MTVSSKSRSIRPFFQKLARVPPAILVSVALAIATLLRMALTPVFGSGYTFITFYPAIIFSTVIGGWRYGLVTVAAAALLSMMLFINPLINVEHATALIVFLTVDGLMIVIADGTGRARRRAELKAELAWAREKELREEITERKRVEEALSEKTARLSLAMKAANLGAWEIHIPSGRDSWDDHMVKLLGLNPEEAEARSDNWLSFVHSDDRERVQAAFNAAVAKASIYVCEFRVPRIDGELRWFVSQGKPICNEEGKVERMVGVIQDISAQRNVETALFESEERMQQALVVSHSFAFEWDSATDNVIRSHSCAAILGLSNEDASLETGQRYFQRIHPEDRQSFVAMLEELNPSKALYHTLYRILRPDGGVVVLEESGHGKFDAAGNLSCLIGFATDVTVREEAVLALRESESSLRRFLDIAAVGLVRVGPDFRYRMVNEAYAKIVGREIEEIIGRSLLEILGEAGFAVIRPYAVRVFQGERVSYEAEFALPKLGQRWLSVHYTPERDATEAVIGWVGSILDITDRKLAEQERERLAAVVQNSHDFIGMSDIDGNPIFVNRAGRDLVGLEHDFDIRSTNIPEYFVPEQRNFVRSVVLPAILAEGRWVGELTFQHFQTKAPIPVYYDLFRIDNSATGQPINFATVTRDLSEQKRGEKAFREADTRFRTMADTAPVLIWETDARGITFVNQHYLNFFGVGLESIFRMGWADFAHPEDKENYIKTYAEAFKNRKPFAFDCRFRRADGQYRWLRNSGCPLDEHHFVGGSLDITEHVQAEETLREDDRRKNQFLATLAHELRNPLAPISNNLHVLQMPGIDSATVERMYAMMERKPPTLPH